MTLAATLRPGESLGDRVMKVDHAGEHGAVCIYRGQRWVAAELARRGVRRCRSYCLCAAGGHALGLVTGLLGRRAIAAEEAQHHDASVRTMGSPTVPLRALMAVVALSTEAVIWLGMNL